MVIGVQEMKVPFDNVNSTQARLRTLGWEASIVPCYGRGNTASCGVGILARPGISVTMITSELAGFFVPVSPRFGFWCVEGGFAGRHIVVVLYLVSGVGLNEENLSILEMVASVLITLKKPFLIMADWNFEPKVLKESSWCEGVGASIADPGRPTCLQGDAARVYDYVVYSSHFIAKPSAKLYDAWTPSPHTAVLFQVPWKQTIPQITVFRKPRSFPACEPFDPCPNSHGCKE